MLMDTAATSFEVLGEQFRLALMIVYNGVGRERSELEEANRYLSTLKESPRGGIDLMIWLLADERLRQLEAVGIDTTQFIFVTLNIIATAIQHAPAKSADASGWSARWVASMGDAMRFFDAQLGASDSSSGPPLLLVKAFTEHFLISKLQQVLSLLLVAFPLNLDSGEDWPAFRSMIKDFVAVDRTQTSLVFATFLYGTLYELCCNLSTTRLNSSVNKKHINRNGRLGRLQHVAAMMQKIYVKLQSQPMVGDDMYYFNLAHLTAEYYGNIVAFPKITPVQAGGEWFSLGALFQQPAILGYNALPSIIEQFYCVVQLVFSNHSGKEDPFYTQLPANRHGVLVREAVELSKVFVCRAFSSRDGWPELEESDKLNIISWASDRMLNLVRTVKAHLWSTLNNDLLCIAVIALCQPNIVTATSGLNLVAALVTTTRAERNTVAAGMLQTALKLILYRMIRTPDIDDVSDFVDEVMTRYTSDIMAKLIPNYVGAGETSSWRERVIESMEMSDDTTEIRQLLPNELNNYRTAFASFLTQLAEPATTPTVRTRVYELFLHELPLLYDEWFNNDLFKQSLTQLPVDPKLLGNDSPVGAKLRPYLSPAYTLIDGMASIIGTMVAAVPSSASASPLLTAAKPMLGRLLNEKLTWLDAAKPEPDCFHWHWIEGRRLDLLTALAHIFNDDEKRHIITSFIVPRRLNIVQKPGEPTIDDSMDVYYLTRRKVYRTVKALYEKCSSVDDVRTIITLLNERMKMVSAHCASTCPQSPPPALDAHPLAPTLADSSVCCCAAERHVITECILSITSAIENFDICNMAVMEIMQELYAKGLTTLTRLAAGPEAVDEFLFGGALGDAQRRRREFCRELLALDSISAALKYPSTLGNCLRGGYVQTGTPAAVQLVDARLTAPLKVTNLSQLFFSSFPALFKAPQSAYFYELLPLCFTLLENVSTIYARGCDAANDVNICFGGHKQVTCNCSKHQLRCVSKYLPAELDVVALSTSVLKQPVQQTWALANLTDPNAPSKRLPGAVPDQSTLVHVQINIHSLHQTLCKLISRLLKLALSDMVNGFVGRQKDPALAEHFTTIRNYIDCTERIINSPAVPVYMKQQIVKDVIRDGFLFGFNGSCLPTNLTDPKPVEIDPYTVMLPNIANISFHSAILEHCLTSSLIPHAIDVFKQFWAQACNHLQRGPNGAAVQPGSFAAEMLKLRCLQFSRAIMELQQTIWPVLEIPKMPFADEEAEWPKYLANVEMSLADCKYLLNSLRAVTHGELIRQLMCRSDLLSIIMDGVLKLLAIPSSEVVIGCHSIIRNYSKLCWKKVSPTLVGKIAGLSQYLDDVSELHLRLYDGVTSTALIFKAHYPILDDPFANDIEPSTVVAKFAMESGTWPPLSLRHHLCGGASGSSAARLLATWKYNQLNKCWELMPGLDQSTHYTGMAVMTLYELLKSAVQMFSLRCVHTILHKAAGYKCTAAELLVSVDADANFKQLILLPSAEHKYQFSIAQEDLVDWLTQLAKQPEFKPIKEQLHNFLFKNLDLFLAH